MIIKLIDIFFLSRPILLPTVYLFMVLGFLLDKDLSTLHFYFDINKDFLLNIIGFSFVMLSIFLSNRINDYEVDKVNRGPGFIEIKNIKLAKVVEFFYIIVGFTIISFSNNFIYYAILYFIALIIGYLYNNKPFYFTGRPFLDFLSNALGYGVVSVILGYVSSTYTFKFNMIFQQDIFLNIVAYFFLMGAGSIGSTLPDIKGDLKNGKITTPIFIGIKKSLILSIIFLIISLILGVKTKNLIVILSSISSIFSYMLPFIFKYKEFSLYYTYQIGGGVLMLITSIFFPYLLITYLFFYIITLIYYKLRHNTIYPKLGK